MGSETHYEALGVDEDATPEQIARAWRQAAARAHPDRGGDPERFRQVLDARDTLTSPGGRAAYNRALREQRAAAAPPPTAPTVTAADPDDPLWFRHGEVPPHPVSATATSAHAARFAAVGFVLVAWLSRENLIAPLYVLLGLGSLHTPPALVVAAVVISVLVAPTLARAHRPARWAVSVMLLAAFAGCNVTY